MLKLRILTAIILLPVIFGLIFASSTMLFEIAMAAILLLGAWEWSRLAGLKLNAARIIYVGLVGCCLYVVSYILHAADFQISPTLLIPVFLWWLVALFWIIRFKPVKEVQSTTASFRFLTSGFLVLCGPYIATLVLRENRGFGPEILFFVLLVIWAADIGAYFVGRKWGRRKLAANVSPGKSWEGVAGALAASLLVAVIGSYFFKLESYAIFLLSAVCVVTVLFSIVGDLYESLVKRTSGFKDSGTILPGHGGVMDRIDSLTAALPTFLMLIGFMGVF